MRGLNNPNLEQLRKRAAALPTEPGVYIMRDSGGKIIYIGKAKSLKNRVSSYFRSVEKHLPKVYRMVETARSFDYIVTDSEFEALVLECSMIKQHSPKYNILLKDDKGYHYIRIHPGPFGKITAEKQKTGEGQYIGPYTSGFVVKQTVDEANKVFKLPTCSRKFPQEIGKGRPCLNYHIKQCMGVCRGKISAEEYQTVLDEAVEFIKGGGGASIKLLTERMNQAAERLEFEKAASYRDRINAINRINQQQKVVFMRQESLDVIAIVQSGDDSCAAVLSFRQGRLVDKEEFRLGGIDSLAATMTDFLTSYYYRREDFPQRIYLDTQCEDKALVEQFLAQRAGRKLTLTVPQRGDGVKLVEMARNNAAQSLGREADRSGRELTAVDELGRLLGLAHPPEYIEAYDISNIGSETIVGGMVVFERGRPLKSAYRKFTIKETVGNPDDYASMAEMIRRRLEHYPAEKDKGVGFGRLPDLILLDGGKGHVSVISALVASMGYQIPVFGMVKDDRHRTRAIAADGGELSISSMRQVFTLVSAIQEEVHRFSIGFSRKRHSTSSMQLRLQQAPGIGPARAKALFKHFKTHKAIMEATQEQLAQVQGMSSTAAAELYSYLHEQQQG